MNVKRETIKMLEVKLEECLYNLDVVECFLINTPNLMAVKEKKDISHQKLAMVKNLNKPVIFKFKRLDKFESKF